MLDNEMQRLPELPRDVIQPDLEREFEGFVEAFRLQDFEGGRHRPSPVAVGLASFLKTQKREGVARVLVLGLRSGAGDGRREAFDDTGFGRGVA